MNMTSIKDEFMFAWINIYVMFKFIFHLWLSSYISFEIINARKCKTCVLHVAVADIYEQENNLFYSGLSVQKWTFKWSTIFQFLMSLCNQFQAINVRKIQTLTFRLLSAI